MHGGWLRFDLIVEGRKVVQYVLGRLKQADWFDP